MQNESILSARTSESTNTVVNRTEVLTPEHNIILFTGSSTHSWVTIELFAELLENRAKKSLDIDTHVSVIHLDQDNPEHALQQLEQLHIFLKAVKSLNQTTTVFGIENGAVPAVWTGLYYQKYIDLIVTMAGPVAKNAVNEFASSTTERQLFEQLHNFLELLPESVTHGLIEQLVCYVNPGDHRLSTANQTLDSYCTRVLPYMSPRWARTGHLFGFRNDELFAYLFDPAYKNSKFARQME